MAISIDWGRVGWATTMALAAAVLGVLAGYDPRIALVVAVCGAFFLIAFEDLAMGLAIFAFVGFVEVVPLFGSVLNLTKLAGALLALSWFAVLATRRDASLDFLGVHPYVATAIGLFLGWATLSMVWAEDPYATLGSVGRYALNLVLFLIVFTAVRSERDLGRILVGFMIGAGFAVGYAFVAPSAEDPGRLATNAQDPNELASVLIPGLALAVAVIALYRRRPLIRLLALLTVISCAAGIWLTSSRGGLIALAIALVFAIAISGRWRPLVAIAATALVAASYVYFAGFASDQVRERITEPARGQARLQEGRTTIYQVAWRAFEANPVLGVGSANFEVSSKHYLDEPGALARTDEIIDRPKVAHNSYLEVMAELGVVGLLLFATIVLFAVSSALMAARTFSRADNRRMQAVALCIAVAMVGILAAGFFLSGQYSKQLWLLLGLGPALLTMARAGAAAGLVSNRMQGDPREA